MSKKSGRARRPEDWSPLEKLRAVTESMGLSEGALGAYLRTHGLHAANLEQWRIQAQEGLSTEATPATKKELTASKKRVKGLEKELRRKNAALAETAALLVLSKKMNALWGDEGEDT